MNKLIVVSLLVFTIVLPSSAIVQGKSRSVPSCWIEDLNEAKVRARKENKFILMVTVRSDRAKPGIGIKESWGSNSFIKEAKKEFVLLMIDTATDSKRLSKLAIEQNPRLVNEYRLRERNDVVILDQDGVVARHPHLGTCFVDTLWQDIKDKIGHLSLTLPQAEPSKWSETARKLRSCEFLLNRDYKKNAKVYLCLFSGSWSSPCRAGMPHIAKTYAETLASDPNVELILFSCDKSEREAKEWAHKHHFMFPVVNQGRGNSLGLDAQVVPRLFVVNGNGKVMKEGHPLELFTEGKIKEFKQKSGL